MELNAEINKVFGQEMAKLFAAQIDEKDHLDGARDAWYELRKKSGYYGDQKSKLQDMILAELKTKVSEEIKAITDTDEFKDECKELAKKMVEEIREETHKKVVEEVSSRLAGMSVGYSGMGIAGMIEGVVMNMMHH